MKKSFYFLFFIFYIPCAVFSQIPRIGAEIWIEPGQSKEKIDQWFSILSENKMPVARIFIMWNYIQTGADTWDFSLYDQAFTSAEKYGVKIEATLTANHGPAFLNDKFWYKEQDGQIPTNRNQLPVAAKYIKTVVERYKSSSALDNWWLQNEPGQFTTHDDLALERFIEYLKNKYSSIQLLNNAWMTNFESFETIRYNESWDRKIGFSRPTSYLDWNWFWREHLTWFMKWVADEIKKTDTQHPLHVNPHGIFDNLPKYDLPEWRNFLSSIGASIHPAWHFSMLKEEQFALGFSAVCDIIKGASNPNPFWVSEMQGGNNILSVNRPLCPSKNDISQWVWTGIGSGAKNVIFWCLNWRMQGSEAGEWSLLNYQNQPSERMMAATEIANTIDKNKGYFENAISEQAPVTILLSPESMLILSRNDTWKEDITGFKSQAHIKSAMAYYEALQEMGIPVQFKQMDDFDWEKSTNHIAILANTIAIRNSLVSKIENFVQRGNKLIVSDLSGYFDENEVNVYQTDFPLEKLVGGKISEIIKVSDIFSIKLDNYAIEFPSHMWRGVIKPGTGEIIGKFNNSAIALRNKVEKGEVLWIPSMIGLGAWLKDNTALAILLKKEIEPFIQSLAFRFVSQERNVILKTLKSSIGYITIISNGVNTKATVELKTTLQLKPEIIVGSLIGQDLNKKIFTLKDKETIVIKWQ